MSVIYFLLLLWISLHACKARNLGNFDHKMEKTFLIFAKTEGKNGFDDSSAMKFRLNNDGDKGMKAEFVSNTEKTKESKNTEKYVDYSPPNVNSGMPHKKLSKGIPRLTSDDDYSPPDVHPPSHNEP